MIHSDTIEDGAPRADGVVKWFDAIRGFGFVVSETESQDLLLHVNVLHAYGQSSVVEGSRVAFQYQETDRGLQITTLHRVDAPEHLGGGDTQAENLPEISGDLPYLPARVKWFDKAKGFGFANVFGSPQDVFVHVDVLRRFGLADLLPGEAICLRAMDGARGRMAVEVRRWEFFSA